MPSPSLVTISDTIYTGPPNNQRLWNGTLTLDAPDMVSNGATVGRWTQTYVISSGVVSLQLVPNTGSTVPSGQQNKYRATWKPDSPNHGSGWMEYWTVGSGGPYTVADIRSSS